MAVVPAATTPGVARTVSGARALRFGVRSLFFTSSGKHRIGKAEGMEGQEKANEAARELSKLGAKKGGRARASVMTAAERSEQARAAAQARWRKRKSGEAPVEASEEKSPVADVVPIAEDMPLPHSLLKGTLPMAGVELECHVLTDGRRVFTQREIVRILSGQTNGDLGRYLSRNQLYSPGSIDSEVIRFKIPGAGGPANGYEATLLIQICELYLDARDQNRLHPSQEKLARVAETVIRGCAKVGIIALIDEATGFQEVRKKNALRLKLQAFISEDMQEWARMFPEEFWLELARLEGTRYSPRNRPLRWGKYVMMFVYDAIDEDIGKKLREINPHPQHRRNHHQWLKDFGREKVNNHIQQVIAIMKLCDDMPEFRRKFDRVYSKAYQLEIAWGDLEAAA